jgi:tetratricopeptide (TPR) repeat protein
MDFQDFQAAIFSLILGDALEEAAMRLIFSFPFLATAESFEPFEFLFLVLNGELIHAKLSDPGTRWMLLNMEAGIRLRDPAGTSDPKIASLLRRMRLIFHEEWVPAPRKLYSRTMHHVTASLARAQRANSNAPAQLSRKLKFVGSVERALRLATLSEDQELLLTALELYDKVHVVAKRPDVDLIKRALVAAAPSELALSAEALVSMYAQFVISAGDTDLAVELVRNHSKEYLERGMDSAYFACVHAEATALAERFNEPRRARELIQAIAARADLNLPAHCMARAELLIADTFWMEKVYSESSNYYSRALSVEYADQFVLQYITERLCDCWVCLGRYKEAIGLIIRALRNRRCRLPHDCIAQFYARLVYAFTLAHDFKKAAISCLALCRTAERAQSDELRSRIARIGAWAVAQIDPSDFMVPKGGVDEIRNGSVLSEERSPAQVDALRAIDPLRTNGIYLTAVIFELAGDLNRSEALLRKALRALEASDNSDLMCLTQSSIYELRVSRVQVKRGRFVDAAASFKKAFSSSIDMARRRGAEIVADGSVAADLWDLVAPATRQCTDTDLAILFDSVCGQFSDNEAAIAWLRFREGKMLFERGLAQAAKRRVVEVERFAQRASDKLLTAEIIWEKLFNRVDEFYSFTGGRQAWLAYALDATLLMAGDTAFNGVRESFANNIRTISRNQAAPPFDQINATTTRYEGPMNDQKFLVIAYALWHAATKHRLIAGSLNGLEVYLRQNATFLSDGDFQ